MRPQGGTRETLGGVLGDPIPALPATARLFPARGPVRLLVSATCVVSGAGTPAGKQGGQRAGTPPLGKGGPSQVPGWSAALPGSGRGHPSGLMEAAGRAWLPEPQCLSSIPESERDLWEKSRPWLFVHSLFLCLPHPSPASLAPEPWAPGAHEWIGARAKGGGSLSVH